MIIVGERLNSTRMEVHRAFDNRDESFILQESWNQEQAGASYIDLNAAMLLDKEKESLSWAIPLIQKNVSLRLSIDTPNPDSMEHGLKLHKGQALMNSMSGETEKVKALMPLVKEYSPKVIVLCLDDAGLPKTADDEIRIAANMVEMMVQNKVDTEDIFLDPLVRSIGTDQTAACVFLDALEKIKKEFPRVKTIAGISNVSFGLPRRRVLNRTLLTLAVERGLDAAIIDPTNEDMLRSIKSTRVLLGKDPDLREFISAAKSKSI